MLVIEQMRRMIEGAMNDADPRPVTHQSFHDPGLGIIAQTGKTILGTQQAVSAFQQGTYRDRLVGQPLDAGAVGIEAGFDKKPGKFGVDWMAHVLAFMFC